MGDEILLERILNGHEEPKDLPLALLESITNNFSADTKIGQGGFGAVYRGTLGNGAIVAVKRIHVNVHTVDDKAFHREFNSLRKINHQNVVRFLGFCSNTYQTSIPEAGSEDNNLANVRERLLCLEYINKGSLDNHITDELRGLEWETRYDIIIGICNGLRYLHEEKRIVHMDLKPANVLLDDQHVPKIADFGLSRPNENSHTAGPRFGTRGYLAPEYENSGKTSVKSDIYSLGAIIIELVTGCMSVPNENNVLRRWRHRWNKPPTPLQYQQVTRCIQIAIQCRQQEPENRPYMSDIIGSLSEPESTNVQISHLYNEDDMLGVKPLELQLLSELKETSCFTVELTNDTRNCIAFNIQPSSPPRYSALLAKGNVRPQSKYDVKITVPAQDMHHAGKFVVKSMRVSGDLGDEDITECMFEEADKVVDEVDLMIVYEPTKPQENCKSRQDTNMPQEEVPEKEAERRKIVESASGKRKLLHGENAEAASVGINSRLQAQCIKQTEQCNFYPTQRSSHHSLGYLLIPLLDRVAAKAGDPLVAKLLQAWWWGKDHHKLKCDLADIQDILPDADAKSRTSASIHRWMTDLKTAAYQTDDVLDDFRYEALRRHAAQIGDISSAHKVWSCCKSLVFSTSMYRKLKDALEMINELVAKMNSFHSLQHTKAPSVVHPQTHSYVDESEILGRQDEKELVVKILLDHSRNNTNNNNVMVLPIVGMGGIGKTTLAQLVHNDQRVVRRFELVIWVCVSQKFFIEEIIQSIIEVATLKKCDLREMEALQKRIGEVLGKKRYLLLMDDVWNEDGQEWDAIRSLLNSHAGSGSAIIVTSRSNKVASIMGTHPPYQVSLLNEDQSWELFHRNAFEREVEKQDKLISTAKSIVHKCKGLPLAIKTIATLLRSKHHNEWPSVRDSDVWKDYILTTTGIVPALQLSYDHLSSDAKICFSCCAIFPKDTPMDKDMLIQLWMANDFIASETRGQQIFNTLVWRCFLQYVEIEWKDRYIYVPKISFIHANEVIHRPTKCKMHDLMHDLAESVSGNDCSFLQESSSRQEILQGSTNASSLKHEVQHLSLDSVSAYTSAAMEEILAPWPRTILVRRPWSGKTPCIPNSLSLDNSKFMSLRALKIFTIEKNITNFKHLRYLDFSYSVISELPEATTTLYSLQTLKLIGCGQLKKLPEGMRYMISLRHIFLIKCDKLKRMPQGIGQLNSLQTLTNYVVDSDPGRGIDQLKDLTLGGALSLTGLRKVHSAENAKDANISAKRDLKQLSLDWYVPSSTSGPWYVPSSTSHGDEVDAEGILEALRPYKTLEALLVYDYPGTEFSSWMRDCILLEHLSELHLSDCKYCEYLPPLWQLRSLVLLELCGLDSVTSICVGNGDTHNGESCISKLEVMLVHNMLRLERLHEEVAGQIVVVSFPQLKRLDISQCPRLETLPERLLQQFPSIEELYIANCPNLHGGFSSGGTYWDLAKEIYRHKSCKTFEFVDYFE